MCGIEKRNLSGPMQTAYRDAALPALFGGSEDAMQGLWPRHPSDSLRQVQQNSGSLPVDALPPQSGRCTADSLLGLAQCDIDPALFGTTDDPWEDGPVYGAKADAPSGPALRNLPLDSARSTYASNPFSHQTSAPYYAQPSAPPSPTFPQKPPAAAPYPPHANCLERPPAGPPAEVTYTTTTLQPVPSFPSAKRWPIEGVYSAFGSPAPARQLSRDARGPVLSPARGGSVGSTVYGSSHKQGLSHDASPESPGTGNGVQSGDFTSSAHSLDSQLSDEWVPATNRRRGQPAFVRKPSSSGVRKGGRLSTSVRQDRRRQSNRQSAQRSRARKAGELKHLQERATALQRRCDEQQGKLNAAVANETALNQTILSLREQRLALLTQARLLLDSLAHHAVPVNDTVRATMQQLESAAACMEQRLQG